MENKLDEALEKRKDRLKTGKWFRWRWVIFWLIVFYPGVPIYLIICFSESLLLCLGNINIKEVKKWKKKIKQY